MGIRNRLFYRYGHTDCEADSPLIKIPAFKDGGNWWIRFYYKYFMVSELNRRSLNFLRSSKAIDEQHVYQVQYSFVIHPFSVFRQFWDIFMMVIFLLQFITIPLDVTAYQLALEETEYVSVYLYFRKILNSLCLFDIFINFLTGYLNYTKRTIILSPRKIVKRYCITFFFIDLVSSISVTDISWFISTDDVRYSTTERIVKFICMLKFCRIYTLFHYCYNIFETSEQNTIKFVCFRLGTYISLYMLYAHVLGCLSAVMTEFLDEDDILTKPYEETEADVVSHYVRFMYETTLLLTCTAMGLRRSTKLLAKIYILVTWIFAKIIYCLFIAYVMQLLVAVTSSKRKYIEKIQELTEYMKHKQLPEYLQKRLVNYYEFRFQRTYFREYEIVNTISGHLRQEINMHTCKKLVENVTFFKNLPATLFVRIVACLKYDIFMQNDVIAKANTTGDSMYFLSTGTVAVYTKSGKEICHLDDGNHFGEIAMVMQDELRVASVIAIETCEMYRLDRNDFIRAIFPYPDLLEKMQRIAAERLEKTAMIDESQLEDALER